MLKVARLVDAVLARLPFDGEKTVLGLGISYLLPFVAPLVAGNPIFLAGLAAVDALAKFLVVAGVAHKPAKVYIDYRDRKEVKELLEAAAKARKNEEPMF